MPEAPSPVKPLVSGEFANGRGREPGRLFHSENSFRGPPAMPGCCYARLLYTDRRPMKRTYQPNTRKRAKTHGFASA